MSEVRNVVIVGATGGIGGAMKNHMQAVMLVAGVAILLSGCGTAQLPERVVHGDREVGERILRRAVDAHGGADRWREIEDVVVRYEGEWASIGPRIQPVLADTGYRRRSTEVVLPALRVIGQLHDGPAGTKRVTRKPDSESLTGSLPALPAASPAR